MSDRNASAGLSFLPALAAAGAGVSGPSVPAVHPLLPPPSSPRWTKERDDALKAVWCDKYTSLQIRAMLGLSRSQLMGRARRLGLDFGKLKRLYNTPPYERSKKVAPKKAAPEPEVLQHFEDDRRVPLPKCCRFIFGDTRTKTNWGYCQAPAVKLDWCAEHYAKVYRPTEKSGEGPGTQAWFAKMSHKGGRFTTK